LVRRDDRWDAISNPAARTRVAGLFVSQGYVDVITRPKSPIGTGFADPRS
jgi:hypothetical protein